MNSRSDATPAIGLRRSMRDRGDDVGDWKEALPRVCDNVCVPSGVLSASRRIQPVITSNQLTSTHLIFDSPRQHARWSNMRKLKGLKDALFHSWCIRGGQYATLSGLVNCIGSSGNCCPSAGVHRTVAMCRCYSRTCRGTPFASASTVGRIKSRLQRSTLIIPDALHYS